MINDKKQSIKKYELSRDNVRKGNMILINTLNEIHSGDVNLVMFSDDYPLIKLDAEANKNLHDVFRRIGNNFEIVPVSGYRPRKEQEQIWNLSLEENGLEYTKKYVALPGCSEHQTGLAIDLAANKEEIDFIAPEFPHFGICEEFRKESVYNGFIERYTSSFEDKTMIAAEEWHFRYVGYPHSVIITEMKMCLEEYIEYLKEFVYPKKPLEYENYRIYYIPYTADDAYILLDSNDSISGNNRDGFVLTRRIT